ncbi:MAG: rhomboid family intramembrane serine protease [Thaumarchaeota archaeon]|nr:rhomboid family intramembrane serine protease [Nitrososphaerota archaeon]
MRSYDSAADSKDLKKCSYCSKPLVGEDAYYFKCRYCEQDFCYEHRLPENHLCKSSPLRRNIPNSTASPYYSTGGSYSTSSNAGQRQGGFAINVSKQGRYLAIAIAAGFVIGLLLSFVHIHYRPSDPYFPPDGLTPLTYFLVQFNVMVQAGWIVPIFTSMIVVLPSFAGITDVAFNAFAVIWLDGLFRSSYSTRAYYGVFILTGVVGNVLSLLLYSPATVSFGASGGIFGLLGGAVTVDYARNGRFNQSLVIWFIFIFFISTFTGGIDVFAHLGGAIAGLIAGYFIGRSGRSNSRYY